MKEELEKRAFQVSIYQKENFEMGVDNVKNFKEKYDLVIYIGNVENASNMTTSRLNWYTFWGQGNNVPWFVDEVPNCYSNNEYFLKAVIGKITGESLFKGKSPIDPFCGREELSC